MPAKRLGGSDCSNDFPLDISEAANAAAPGFMTPDASSCGNDAPNVPNAAVALDPTPNIPGPIAPGPPAAAAAAVAAIVDACPIKVPASFFPIALLIAATSGTVAATDVLTPGTAPDDADAAVFAAAAAADGADGRADAAESSVFTFTP